MVLFKNETRVNRFHPFLPDTSLAISVDGSILFIKEKIMVSLAQDPPASWSELFRRFLRRNYSLFKTDITVIPFQDDIDSLGYRTP